MAWKRDMSMEEMIQIRKEKFGEIRKVNLGESERQEPLHGSKCTCERCWVKCCL